MRMTLVALAVVACADWTRSATVNTPRDALERIASAPFVPSVSASCGDDRVYPTAP